MFISGVVALMWQQNGVYRFAVPEEGATRTAALVYSFISISSSPSQSQPSEPLIRPQSSRHERSVSPSHFFSLLTTWMSAQRRHVVKFHAYSVTLEKRGWWRSGIRDNKSDVSLKGRILSAKTRLKLGRLVFFFWRRPGACTPAKVHVCVLPPHLIGVRYPR